MGLSRAEVGASTWPWLAVGTVLLGSLLHWASGAQVWLPRKSWSWGRGPGYRLREFGPGWWRGLLCPPVPWELRLSGSLPEVSLRGQRRATC